jgi:general secretion pathway protein M
MNRPAMPSQLSAVQGQLIARWQALAPRERRLLALGGGVVALFILWLLFIAPAWHTVREAPAKLDHLDAQLQQMQRLAAEGRELHNTPPTSAAQSAIVLKAATDRLGERAKLSVQGDRAVLTINNTSGEQLRGWLADARSGAHARPIEAHLNRGPQGYNGTLVVSLGGAG